MAARRILAALIVVSSVFVAPAGAQTETAATVTVTFHVDARSHDSYDPVIEVPIVSCELSVAEGGDPIAVLDAAVAQHCIESYRAQYNGAFIYIACINRVCNFSGYVCVLFPGLCIPPGPNNVAWWWTSDFAPGYTTTEGSEIHAYFNEVVTFSGT